MVNAFRYVVDDNLYTAFSQLLRIQDDKKVFGIKCPDFCDNGFEVIETGVHNAPYQLMDTNHLNPFTKTLLQWFADYRLLSES